MSGDRVASYGLDELKRWRCRGGHTLGLVVRRGRRRVMLLLREAIGEGDELAEVEVMAVVEGRVVDVVCSICGGVRTWFEER